MTERLHFDFSLPCIGEGNGNPLKCSCLENPRDGGAWWTAVYEVAQSWTLLKGLNSSRSNEVKYRDFYFQKAKTYRIYVHGCLVASVMSDPMDCSPPGFSVHGILQARILEWVAISSSISYLCVFAKLLQLCPTLCNPMDHSPPGFSVHGILQARILVAMPSSRESS